MNTPINIILADYLASLEVRSKPSSVRTARCQAARLSEFFGADDATGLRPTDVDRYCASRPVSKGSINGELRTLKAALHRAVDNADLDRLPCKIKLLKTGSKLPTVLDECQLRLLLKASPQLWLRTLLLLGAKAGLRHAEALWLRPCDIDADEIRVVSKAGWSPKSHHERRLPLRSPSLRAALDEYLPTVADRGWLFPGYDGGPLAGAHKAVRAAFKTAGLYDRADRSGMHMLRRTWATALLGAGVDIETVRQLGGWRDIETVQRYVTSDAKRKDAAMGAIG